MKNYSSSDILKMAVSLIEKDMAADLNKDGRVNAVDATGVEEELVVEKNKKI